MSLLAPRVRVRLFPRSASKSALLAGAALLLLSALFLLGRPWNVAEHDRYHTRLRHLRVASAELEQDLLRARLGMPLKRGTSEAHLVHLRAQARALMPLPSFLGAEAQGEMRALIGSYLSSLEETERQVARYARAQQEVEAALLPLPSTVRAARSTVGPAGQGDVEVLARALLLHGAGSRLHVPTPLQEALTRLSARAARTPQGPEREALQTLVARSQQLLDARRAAEAALAGVLEHPLDGAADRLIGRYLQHYAQALTRSERFRVLLFSASLLLGVYVALVLVYLARTSRALADLNAGLEEHVVARTAELAQANAELLESEARKAALLEASPDGILALDAGGRVMDFNPAAEHTFGVARGDALGRPAVEVMLPAEAQEGAWARLRAQVEGAGERSVRLELLARRADGQRFPAELTLARVSECGGPVRFSAIVRDITERKEVERLKNEFVSTVSHELRTPLTSIRGSLGLLEGGVMGPLPGPALDLVRIARTNTERLVRLINDILDLEKMEAGKLELRAERLCPRELLEATAEGLRATADAAGVLLRVDAPEPLPVVGDRDRLLQVLTNLVSNGVKFSPPGAELRLSARRAPTGGVRFAVQDRGPGIPPEQRSRLFGRFQQLDSSDTRARGGTGLGLAISRAIVEQHGSQLEVDSAVGQGSTFHFTLPAAEPAPSTAASGLPSHHLLLVEDDALTASGLARLLSAEGYRVTVATCLQEAEAQLAAQLPDALLLDLVLPDGDGLELLARLRTRAGQEALPVVVLTGLDLAAELRPMPLVMGWLTKPVDKERLLDAVRRALRRPGQARVLIVEDDPDTRRVLHAHLDQLGVQCLQAADGARAIALAREQEPDLILLDVGLPGLDGFAVVDILRQGRSRATPLLVYSGRDLSPRERRRLTLGLTEHLTKARADDGVLLQHIRRALGDLLPAPHPRRAHGA